VILVRKIIHIGFKTILIFQEYLCIGE